MGEVPRIEDIISPYAGEFRIGDKICKIKKPSIRKRIELIKDSAKNEKAEESDFVTLLERSVDVALEVTENADREDLMGLDFEQINWILGKATGREADVPVVPEPGTTGTKRKNR